MPSSSGAEAKRRLVVNESSREAPKNEQPGLSVEFLEAG